MSDEFRDYKSAPTSDTLIRLLRAQQDRVYRLCFQVLRSAHDAEDAAQEALILIAQGARAIDDAEGFRRWVYRVSLNAALEAARKSARRRAHESRAVMKESTPPLDDETRRALFEAVERLDDRARGVLLDHCVEGETLESIGAREGVTPQAVSKRLERAREDLRKALPAAFLGIPDLGRLVDRSAMTAPPDLVSGPVLAKVAAVAGGAALMSKSVILPVAIATLLVASVGAGLVALTVFPLPDVSRADFGGSATSAPAEETLTAVPLGGSPLDAPQPASPEVELARLSPLEIRLQEFKTWWEDIEAERLAASGDSEKYEAWRKRHEKELWEHVSGVKDLILAHPEQFVAFLRDPLNEGLLMDLTQMYLLQQTDKPYVYFTRPFAEYPRTLTQGLFDLLYSGTVRQRVASFRLLSSFTDVPEEFRNAYLAMVDDPSPEVQGFAIHQVGKTVTMTPDLFSKLSALGTGSDSQWVRTSVLGVMCRTPGPEAESFILNRLTTVTEQGELFNVFLNLSFRYEAERRTGHPIQEERLARALSEFAARAENVRVFWFFQTATYLPGSQLKPILMDLQAKRAYAGFRDRLQMAIEKIDQGTSNRDELMKILDPR